MKKKQSIQVNAILNVIKQGCVIVFPLVTYSYITRVLGSDNLGRYSFSDSVIQYFITIASLGVPTYAIREVARVREDKEKMEKLTTEFFSINVLMTIISLLTLYLMVKVVPRINQEAILIYILSIEIIAGTLGRDWLNNVFENFFYLTLRYIVIQTISMILILTLVKSKNDLILYTCIMMISYSMNYILNIYFTRKYLPYRFTFHLNLKTHLKPIIYLFCVSIAAMIYVKSDIIILGFFRSNSEVGVYSIASNVYTVIKSLLNAVIVVAIPRISVYLGNNDRKNYMSLLSGLRNVLYVFAIPSIIGLFFLSKDILAVLAPPSFAYGSNSLRILCIALFFTVIGCFYSQAVLVPNRNEKSYFYATIISGIVNISLNFVFIPLWGLNGAAITTVLAEIIVMFICRRGSEAYIDTFSSMKMMPLIIGCIAIAIICQLCQMFVTSLFLRIIISVFGSVIVYGIILLVGKNEVALNGMNMIKSKIKKYKDTFYCEK